METKTDINSLTIGEARQALEDARETVKELSALFGQAPDLPEQLENASKSTMIGQHCVVRTYSAGVHIGTVERVDGTTVLLSDAVRLWKWESAFTLSEVAQNGVGSGSRIAVAVPQIELSQAIELIPTTDAARATFGPRNNG